MANSLPINILVLGSPPDEPTVLEIISSMQGSEDLQFRSIFSYSDILTDGGSPYINEKVTLAFLSEYSWYSELKYTVRHLIEMDVPVIPVLIGDPSLSIVEEYQKFFA